MKEKLLHERALVTCIAMLFICIILKLFGVQWFDLNTDIPILQEIDNVVMNSVPLSFLYSFIFRFINSYLIYMIVTKDKRPTILLLITVITSMLVRPYIDNDIILLIIDFNILLIPCLGKCKIKEYYLTMFLNLFYQFLSLFIRSLGYQSCNYGLIISALLNLDYYIMFVITYLYLIKGGYTLCGIVQVSYFSLANLLWKKRSENYSNKEGN